MLLPQFEYPISAPEYLCDELSATDRDPNQLIFEIWGLVSATIVLPRNMWFGCLPYTVPSSKHCHFPTCHTCVSEGNVENFCTHSDKQRAMTYTWCSCELQHAVEVGAKILRIHHAWHWPPERRSNQLFSGYMKKMLTLKLESSGWDPSLTTEEQRVNFVHHMRNMYDVEINPARVTVNKGLRYWSKATLNSLVSNFATRLIT